MLGVHRICKGSWSILFRNSNNNKYNRSILELKSLIYKRPTLAVPINKLISQLSQPIKQSNTH